MRPRHKAAENGLQTLEQTLHYYASMRPRHKAAENVGFAPPSSTDSFRFNEAAA